MHLRKLTGTYRSIFLTVIRLHHGQLRAIIEGITVFLQFQHECHREPRNEVSSLSPVEHLVVFEPGTFRL